MTLDNFNKLDFFDQLKLVWGKGTFADTYITKNEYIKCYAVDMFFVEVVYDNKQKEILDVRPFVTGHSLDKYVVNFNRVS